MTDETQNPQENQKQDEGFFDPRTDYFGKVRKRPNQKKTPCVVTKKMNTIEQAKEIIRSEGFPGVVIVNQTREEKKDAMKVAMQQIANRVETLPHMNADTFLDRMLVKEVILMPAAGGSRGSIATEKPKF
jgi:hypothetical protein